jgi:hypothetical protein
MYSSDIHRSDSSSANADELKRIKSLMTDLQDELEESFAGHTEKFESIESMITDLQSRFSQMENHVGRCVEEMDSVSLKCFCFRNIAILNVALGEKIIELDDEGNGTFQNG